MFFNYLLIFILIAALFIFVGYLFSKSESSVIQDIRKEGRAYNIDQMTEFIKARMDEITRTNLYDIRTNRRWT